ncbi:hypothetical protein [Streptomyces aureus]|uniref:Secreted protein/lipoprotein n=1 Tax=Streptomyces aureus TaxID=193461 RepID=A0ABV4SXC2_9ACTN
MLKVYNAMTAEETKAYQRADVKGTDLEKYASLDALGKIRNDVALMKEAGTVVRGGVQHDAEVTGINLTAKVPEAKLKDCVDLSKYETYDTKAKKVIPLPTSQPLRYYATATAQRWDGRWIVTDVDTQGGSKC